MKKQRKATIRTVAEAAGVSVATVSYVINDGPRPVTPATRQKVLDAMDKLKYEPNAAARTLANKRTNTIGLAFAGLVDSNLSGMDSFEYVRGISYEVETGGFNLLLFGNHRQSRNRQFYEPIVRSHMVDGILLIGSSIPDDEIVELYENRFPAVLIARSVPGHNVYCVQQDYRQGAYLATSHLLRQGYRRVGFLGQAPCFSYAMERLAGYRQALEDGGIPYDEDLVQIPADPRDDPTEEDILRFFHLRSPVDSLLTDREVHVMNAIRTLGYRVPEDAALVGLDESETGKFLNLPLTTVRSPKFEIGVTAVRMLRQLIAGETVEEANVVLPMELIIRDSSPLH